MKPSFIVPDVDLMNTSPIFWTLDTLLDQPIVDLLNRIGLFFVGQLVQQTRKHVRNILGIGKARLRSICAGLDAHGLALGTEHHDPTVRAFNHWFLKDPVFLEVSVLSISTRIANHLNDEEIVFVGQLISKSEAELMLMTGIGPNSILEIKYALHLADLHLETPANHPRARLVQDWANAQNRARHLNYKRLGIF